MEGVLLFRFFRIIVCEKIIYQHTAIFAFWIYFAFFTYTECTDIAAFVHFVKHKKELSDFS